MGFYSCASKQDVEDGNNIVYPVANPSIQNKMYVEKDVSAIAYALGEQLTVSEMAGAVKTIVEAGGLSTYKGSFSTLYAEGSIQPYEVV